MYSIKKSYGLDFIRVIASLLVFIPHIIINFSNNLVIVNNAYLTSIIGVEIFFCLSGYLICRQGMFIVNSKKNYIKNTLIFIIRRILRTWPTYFFALLCYAIFYKFFEKQIAYYLFFIQNLFYPMVSDTFFAVSWSICVEELFYFIFPILLALIIFFNKKIIRKSTSSNILIIMTCLLIIIITYIIRNHLIYDDWGPEVRRVAFLRLDAIAFGGLGYFFLYFLNRYKYLNITLIIISFVSITVSYYYLKKYIIESDFQTSNFLNNYIFYYFYIFSICIINLSDKLVKISKKYLRNILSELAYWSYPLYLMHILIIDLIKSLQLDNLLLNIVIIIIINFLCAFFIRKYIELPFIKIRPNFLK